MLPAEKQRKFLKKFVSDETNPGAKTSIIDENTVVPLRRGKENENAAKNLCWYTSDSAADLHLSRNLRRGGDCCRNGFPKRIEIRAGIGFTK
ncbi:MAG: hypothetical protein ACI3V0_08165 [Faecousia sp.]